jgi:hypothetical protein
MKLSPGIFFLILIGIVFYLLKFLHTQNGIAEHYIWLGACVALFVYFVIRILQFIKRKGKIENLKNFYFTIFLIVFIPILGMVSVHFSQYNWVNYAIYFLIFVIIFAYSKFFSSRKDKNN